MSNLIQIRRGTEAERASVVFSSGEPVYCIDSNKLYIGDGITAGGKLISGGGGGSAAAVILDTLANIQVMVIPAGQLAFATDSGQLFIGTGVAGGVEFRADSYVRAGYSRRFNASLDVKTVGEALDWILDMAAPSPDRTYFGDIADNSPAVLANPDTFLASLAAADYAAGSKSVSHNSNNTYRVFAYKKSHGLLTDIQDPGFMNASIRNSYEPTPRQITDGLGVEYYVYISDSMYMSPAGQVVNYILP